MERGIIMQNQRQKKSEKCYTKDVYMPEIQETTKRNLSKIVGLDYEEILKMDTVKEIAYVESRIGKPIVFSTRRTRQRIGRGNPLLARRKFRTLEEVEKKLGKV